MRWAILCLVGAGWLCGCGSDSGSAMSPGQVTALCDGLIEEFEAACTAAQRQELDDIRAAVEGWNPGPVHAVQVPDTVTIAPRNAAHLYRMYGVTALLQGKIGPGVWASAMAARQAPTDPAALEQLAVMLIERRRCEEARRLLETARRREDGDRSAVLRLSLASALACLGREVEAAEALEEAAALAPRSALVERATREFLLGVMGDALKSQPAHAEACDRDLRGALELATMDDLSRFVTEQGQESQTLAMEAMSLVQRLPGDLPDGFIDELTAIDEQYETRARTEYEDPAMEALDRVTGRWTDGFTALTEQEAACCAAQGGHCCPCLQDQCEGMVDLSRQQVLPESFDALVEYLPGRLRLLQETETALQRFLFRARSGTSAAAMEWAAAYLYNLLAQHCKAVALTTANLVQPPLSANLAVDPICALPQDCRDAQREAQIAEQRRRAEEERERRAREAEAKALAAELAVDLSLRFNVCLDGLACLGVDGSQVSFRLSSEVAFALFSVDLESYDVGLRVGVGVGDPTGHLWGMDVYVGATVGPGGTSFQVGRSEGGFLASQAQDVTVFQERFRF